MDSTGVYLKLQAVAGIVLGGQQLTVVLEVMQKVYVRHCPFPSKASTLSELCNSETEPTQRDYLSKLRGHKPSEE